MVRFVFPASLHVGRVGAGDDLVDDFLEEDHVYVDVAGDVGEELGDEGSRGSVAMPMSDAPQRWRGVVLDAGDVEVGEFGADGVVDQRGVVGHARAVVVLADVGVRDGVKDAPPERRVRHAVVARVLVREGRDQEGADEFALRVFEQAVAGEASPAGKARPEGGVGFAATAMPE